MIPLTRDQHLGQLLRQLRHDAGLSLRQLGARAHVSKSGVSKRELHEGMSAAGLIQHAGALGYAVALVPIGTRPTGTGWPT